MYDKEGSHEKKVESLEAVLGRCRLVELSSIGLHTKWPGRKKNRQAEATFLLLETQKMDKVRCLWPEEVASERERFRPIPQAINSDNYWPGIS